MAIDIEEHNPLIADPLYLVRYVEQAGTGILDAIKLCREAGLPEPEFRQDGGQFVMTLWRNRLTDKVLAGLNLNERQKQAMNWVKVNKRITNLEYQKLTKAERKTAARDLDELVKKKALRRKGTKRETYYEPPLK